MKKILLFLLLSIATYGQVSTGQEQEFDYGIKNNAAQEITTPAYIGTIGVDGTNGKIPSAYIEKTDNKQNSLAVDGTGVKYVTVDAVNDALPKNYAKIVYVNSTNPSTATIFDIVNPPVTNDNLLKTDVANLYIGTDASTWVYDMLVFGYITKALPAVSNFYISGSSADAGSNKINPIYRVGTIQATGFIKSGGFSSQFLKADGSLDSSVYAQTALTVRKISTNTTLSNTDNGAIILLTSSCTVTLPNGLMSGFNCSFSTLAGATLTYSLGGSVVLLNNLGTTMAEKLSHTIVNTGVSNEYLTAGSL